MDAWYNVRLRSFFQRLCQMLTCTLYFSSYMIQWWILRDDWQEKRAKKVNRERGEVTQRARMCLRDAQPLFMDYQIRSHTLSWKTGSWKPQSKVSVVTVAVQKQNVTMKREWCIENEAAICMTWCIIRMTFLPLESSTFILFMKRAFI